MAKDILKGIAIASLIVASSIFIPVMGFFFTMLVPLPIIFYRTKLGRKPGAFIPIVVTCLTVLATGGFSVDIVILIELFILGFVFSELIAVNISIEKTVMLSGLTVWMTTIVAFLFYSSLANDNMIDMVSGYVGKNLDYTVSLYKEMGMPDETILMIERSMERIQYVIVRIIPAFAIASTLLIIWLNLLMAKSILIKKGLPFPNFGPLNQWKSPEILVWAAIVSGIMVLLPGITIKIIGINVLLALTVIYFFQGIAIVAFFFEKKKLPRMLRLFLYSIIGFQQIVLILVIGIGLFDVWFDLRKLNKIEIA